MPAPADRERAYVEKRPDARWDLEANFDERLPEGVVLTAGTVRIFDATNEEVPFDLLCSGSVVIGGGQRSLLVLLKETPLESSPTIAGVYRFEWLGQTSQDRLEPLTSWVHIREGAPT